MKLSIVWLSYNPDSIPALDAMDSRHFESMIESSYRESSSEIIHVTRIDDVKGQARAVNQGFARAKGDWIYLVCNDILIEDPDWLEKLACPGNVASWQPRDFVLNGRPTIEMSLFGFPREIYDTIGGWDEAFADGYGFEDDDWLIRAKRAGFGLVYNPSVKATHLCSQTFKAYYGVYGDGGEFTRLYDRNKEIFKRKYPELEPEGGWLR